MLDCRQRLLFGVSIGEDAVQTVEENVVGKEGEEKKHRQDDIQPQMSGVRTGGGVLPPFPPASFGTDFSFSSLTGTDVLVLDNLEPFDIEAIRIVIAAARIEQATYGHETALGHIGGTDNHLPGMRPYRIGIAVEVTEYAVHLYDLIDISRDDTVVVPFL